MARRHAGPHRRGDIDRRAAPAAAARAAGAGAGRPSRPWYPTCRPASRRIWTIPEYIERNHITNKEPHKENLIGCSGGAQSWLWQVREPWQNRST